MAEELIVLLDDHHQPIGTAPKLASHHAKTPLHLAFSCYIFNGVGELLVTQRALSKKVWPGVWTNSVCGHPAPGESVPEAIYRRADHELGIKDLINLRVMLPDYQYKTPPYNGVIENEFCPVYFADFDGKFQPNPDEVEDFYWQAVPDLQLAINNDPETYSYWLKDQLDRLNV